MPLVNLAAGSEDEFEAMDEAARADAEPNDDDLAEVEPSDLEDAEVTEIKG
jgi:hypothetical protein